MPPTRYTPRPVAVTGFGGRPWAHLRACHAGAQHEVLVGPYSVVPCGVTWLVCARFLGGGDWPRAVAQEAPTAWDRDDPQGDGWSTEVLQEAAGQQLRELAHVGRHRANPLSHSNWRDLWRTVLAARPSVPIR